MDEARAVLTRLERIEALDREAAHPTLLLAELRELMREAEEWARIDGDERAEAAVAALGEEMLAPAVKRPDAAHLFEKSGDTPGRRSQGGRAQGRRSRRDRG